jgi:hypothetical protein
LSRARRRGAARTACWGRTPSAITNPSALRPLWPAALAQRIDNGSAHVIHIPFLQDLIKHAIKTFDYDNYPRGGGLGFYS